MNYVIKEQTHLGTKPSRNDFKRENQTRSEINVLTFTNLFFIETTKSVQNYS